jgi:hypothetical protein
MTGLYNITPPVQGQPIPSVGFGLAVKNAINDLDSRMSAVEGSFLPRYYSKDAVTNRNSTITPAIDSGGLTPLANIPLEIGSFEIEFVGLVSFTSTGTQGVRIRWAFTGAINNPIINCMGPGDNATGPTANATLMCQAKQALSQDSIYFTAASAGWASFREISTNFVVTTPGNLSINWAQAVSSANNTNLQPGSYFRVTRYA